MDRTQGRMRDLVVAAMMALKHVPHCLERPFVVHSHVAHVIGRRRDRQTRWHRHTR